MQVYGIIKVNVKGVGMKFYTVSGREISFYGAGINENIDKFFGILLKSWIKRDEDYDFYNDPAHNQCTVTAMVVQDFFGGEILGLKMPGGGMHYLNMINGKKFDLTSDQFTSHGIELDYSETIIIPRPELGTEGTAPERYMKLKVNIEGHLAAK